MSLFRKEREAVTSATAVVRDASTTSLMVSAVAVVIALVAIIVVALNVKGIL